MSSSEEIEIALDVAPEVAPEATISTIPTPDPFHQHTPKNFVKEPKIRNLPQGSGRRIVLATNDDGEFGDFPLCDSTLVTNRTWVTMRDIIPANEGKKVWLRARAQTVRGRGKICFFQLRDGLETCQACAIANDNGPSIDMVKYAANIPSESWIDVFGVIAKAEVKLCTMKEAEISITKIFVVSAATNPLPFQITDAQRGDPNYNGLQADTDVAAEYKISRVPQTLRFIHRHVDLRTSANQAIFKVQSRIGQFFCEFLYQHNFMEIHTPKITQGVSEGGHGVFSLNYCGNDCYLAQSPQLYKKMATVSDFGRVFEIGHVFRAENPNNSRHLCQFVSLDLEMVIGEHYHEALDLIGNLFIHIFNRLNQTCVKEIEAVHAQYPFTPGLFQDKIVCIPFTEAHEMLISAGELHQAFDGFSTAQERKLGGLMREKYNCDLYIVDRLPSAICPFYTMPCADDPRYSNSFDVFLRGEEISSGGQRLHDPELLRKRASDKLIPLEGLKPYLVSFENGALPHAGCGIGLERMTFLFFGLQNIHLSSMFPAVYQK